MPKETIIGIDLGTSNSCVSFIEGGIPTVIPNSEGKRTTPSVIAFPKESQGERKVGDPAKRQAIINPTRTLYSVKSFIGKKYHEVSKKASSMPYKVVQGTKDNLLIKVDERGYTPQEISAMVLRKLGNEASEYLGKKITKAVITVPAYFNDAERQATKEAGEIAGLEVIRIINEPTAAALAYGLNKKEDKNILVFDLGGGTFDVSLLSSGGGVFEVKATSGDTNLGGDDIDQRIIAHLAKQFQDEHGVDLSKQPEAMQRLREAAEKTKIELSNSPKSDISLPYMAVVDNAPKHFATTLSRPKFEQMIAPECARLLGPCQEVMRTAGIDKKDVDEIVLVGGSTRIPKVQQLVKEFFSKEPSKNINPDETVAMGAAIQGAILAGDSDVGDIVLLDVTPLSLGIETKGGITTKLIEANTTIPTRKSEIFSTADDNQPSVDIRITQGERPMAADNKTIGYFQLTGIKPAPRGVPQIEVSFDIDVNGILQVSAKDKETNKEHTIRVEGSSGTSKEEIERMKREAEEHAEADKKRKEETEKLNQAESLIFQTEKRIEEFGDKVPEATQEPLKKALADLKKAHEEKDTKAIDTQIAALFPHMAEANKIFEEAKKQDANAQKPTEDKKDTQVEDADYVEEVPSS